jgi:hypothetical protein
MEQVTLTGEKKDAYQTVIRKPEGQRHLGELSIDGRMVGLLK